MPDSFWRAFFFEGHPLAFEGHPLAATLNIYRTYQGPRMTVFVLGAFHLATVAA
ncbi:hypothetical protein [Streptomyces sp. NBC_01565]|uniref:hypothetical protein n=1 Tax=Streptomyces sp. NBC_01565 TaxID=2975881 RepID=UPI00225AB481|nr:hypothetical protein [Streptomyces sp. NBC_01565]MCX4539795.1 hypothetical protein [Streptomyces sp. NBC_01565]